MRTETSAPVTKTLVVAVPPERAFELFTARVAEWWPVETHALHAGEVETVVNECREGGRVYERTADGREATWSRILAWEPPHRVLYTWEVSREGDTELELRFEPVEGGTRVELEHRGWEALGAAAAERRESYRTGWDFVLGRYAEAAG